MHNICHFSALPSSCLRALYVWLKIRALLRFSWSLNPSLKGNHSIFKILCSAINLEFSYLHYGTVMHVGQRCSTYGLRSPWRPSILLGWLPTALQWGKTSFRNIWRWWGTKGHAFHLGSGLREEGSRGKCSYFCSYSFDLQTYIALSEGFKRWTGGKIYASVPANVFSISLSLFEGVG